MQNSERRCEAPQRGTMNGRGMVAASATLWSVALVVSGILVASCDNGPYKPPALHQYSKSYDFTIQPDEAPPHARDDVHYTIEVFDRKTREPIVNGEGQLFAGKPIDDAAPTGPQSHT